jgi:hypothetical protein
MPQVLIVLWLAISMSVDGSHTAVDAARAGTPQECLTFEARYAPHSKVMCDAWFAAHQA